VKSPLECALTVLPNEEEKQQLLKALYGDVSELQDPSFVEDYYNEIFHHLHSKLSLFEEYSFSEEFGFTQFELRDICYYLLTDSKFNLSLNRPKGQGLLYGLTHANIRRSIFNELPFGVRKHVVAEKCRHFGIFDILNELPFFSEDVEWDEEHIDDVQDIGMGHSVYHIRSIDSERQVVLKRESLPHQAYYCGLLRELNWPSFFSYFKSFKGETWALLQYLGDLNLGDYIKSGFVSDEKGLLRQLARHAALGDIMGRGDRHFENYMVCNDQLLPVDVSFLFWEGNESWLQKYVSAGMSEVTILDLFVEEDDFMEMFDYFLTEYDSCLDELFSQQNVIVKWTETFFQGFEESDKYAAFIAKNFSNLELFKMRYRRLYVHSFFDFQVRKFYKHLLAQIHSNDPESIAENERLKMYFLADQGRFSSFFLWDEYQEEIVRFIQERAQEVLGASPHYFSEHERGIAGRKVQAFAALCS